ncbi:hypothetical protein [Bacillus pumilus]|uniref:hypothetical protein n=1 Tax=Bacillus pumilus TaxID=1408 RepID=UPI00164310B7|nr:hypothetical protein [Bacillus pumilus]
MSECVLKELREEGEEHYEVKEEGDLFEGVGILENELKKEKRREVMVKGMV